METRESDPGGTTRQLHGRDAVADAGTAARAFGEAQWLTDDESARLCVIVEELVANLYDHGGLTAEDRITLSLNSDPNGIRIVIIDPGTPFDPRTLRPGTNRSGRGAGAGIDIVRAWAEIIDYSVTGEGNRLSLLLPIGQQS